MAKDTLKSVENTFQIIELLAKQGMMGVRELAAETGMSTTVTHRMLSTLAELGYATQDAESGKYLLSYRIAALGNQVQEQNTLVRLAHPYLKALSDRCRETVHLVERAGTNIRYIDKVTPAANMFATGSYIGLEFPLAGTAVGKAILAQLSLQEVKEIWEDSQIVPYTPYTITSLEALEGELEVCRKTGFAYDREEREMGLMCIGICVKDYRGRGNYGISISAPVVRMQEERLGEIQKMLLETRDQLSRCMCL